MTAYYTIGFDTATNTVVVAINKLRDTNCFGWQTYYQNKRVLSNP